MLLSLAKLLDAISPESYVTMPSGHLLETENKRIDLFSLYFFVFPIEFPGEHGPFSFHNLCADMHVNLTKFERKGSLEYYRMTFIGKTKLRS